MVKLTNRIEALRMRDDDPDEGDVPADAKEAAKEGITKPGDSKPLVLLLERVPVDSQERQDLLFSER